METVKHLVDFRVFEFRRYIIRDGEREHFAEYFDTYFPEALQQLGAVAAGQFLERGNDRFTWVRGFHTIEDRAVANARLYYGPLWKEHKSLMNGLMTDSDDVLLLQPLSPGHGVDIFPAVDPVAEKDNAKGVAVAQIFAIEPDAMESLAHRAEVALACCRVEGVREAGMLATLDVPNNFPQLPIRTDGPYLVWLGIVKDERTLESRFRPLAESASRGLADAGLLRGAPELAVMDPTRRSRLRWTGRGH